MDGVEGARTFQTSGSAYDRFMGRYSVPLAPRFADAAGVAAGQRVLDVGCGPGALTTVLAERVGVAAVSACDPSPPFLDECRNRVPGVDARPGRAEQLPFGDDEFDAALAQLVLHFVSDPPAAAAEMRRVVRPGGAVATCVWDFAGEMEMLRTFWDAAQALDPDADHREVLTTLLGELTAVPWQRPHAVPSGTVLSTWRAAIGEAPLQQLQRELLAAVGTEHRDPALPRVEVGGGLRLGAIDGTVTRMPDTRPTGPRSAPPGRPRPATRRSVTCTSPTRSPGPPWPWCVARPAGTRPGQGRGRAGAAGPDAGRAARRCSAPTGCGSWIGTSPACRGSRRCWPPAATSWSASSPTSGCPASARSPPTGPT